jgi:Ca2+-binding RTX toxin-like protein
VKEILFRWAGVSTLSGDERGSFVDSRELGFMEKAAGTAFKQRGIYSNPQGAEAGENITEAFHDVLHWMYARIIGQFEGKELFVGDVYYDYVSDNLIGVTGLNADTIELLENHAIGLSSTAEREVVWLNVLRVIEFTVGVDSLSGGDQTVLSDAIEASDVSLELASLLEVLEYVRDIGLVENGTSGNDTENGSSADDRFDGLGGDDTLYGNAGNDTLDGGADNDILDGGTGGDFLDGGNGNDTFIYDLGDGEDTIIEGGGTDEILMGAGIDAGDITLSRAGAEDLVIDIDTGSQTGRIIIENHFTTNGVVEQIEFSDTSTLALTTQNWTISGTSGNDYLYGVKAGGGTTDTIYGGAGHDVIYGYTGDDTLYGEDGNDAIYGHTGGGSSTTDTMYGGNGNDYIEGSSAIDIIHDGAGDDVAVGGSGNDEYHYTSGHDTYDDSNGTDEIFLPTGFSSAGTVYYKIGNTLQIVLDAGNSITIPDYYAGTQYQIETLDFFSDPDVDLTKVSTITQGGTGNDTLNGTSGNDTFYGNGGHDTLYGDDGNDTLYGGIGNDALYGQDDNDIVDGGAGDDYVAGGYGADTYVYVSGHDTYTEVTSGSSSDLILMGAAWTLADLKFERHQIALNSLLDAVITINGSNSITIKSMFSQSSNLIETIEFMDTSTISLSAQQFTTYGSSSNDVINGISVNGSTADIIYGNAGLDDIDGGNGDDIIYGGDDHDELYGGNNDDQLFGDAGNDYIAGENGNDTLRGGAGDDVLVGYDGNDLYIYDSGLDTITETLNDTDTLWIAGGRTINDMTIANYGTDEAKITITASVDEIIVYNLRGSASQRVEYITFDDGFTTTLPDYGSWINGTSGNDVAAGNSSDNTIIGFAGNDTITGAGGSDKAHGGAGDDSLDGGDGADLLYGGEDDDILSGKAGLDTLHGGDGADTFVFETASAFSDIDVIRDFSVTDADVLDLTDILDTVYDPLNDAIADFVSFSESSGSTFVSVDRDGTGGTYSMAQIIKLENVTGLASPDTLETNGNLLAA